jgi:hypothetical protein
VLGSELHVPQPVSPRQSLVAKCHTMLFPLGDSDAFLAIWVTQVVAMKTFLYPLAGTYHGRSQTDWESTFLPEYLASILDLLTEHY